MTLKKKGIDENPTSLKVKRQDNKDITKPSLQGLKIWNSRINRKINLN